MTTIATFALGAAVIILGGTLTALTHDLICGGPQ